MKQTDTLTPHQQAVVNAIMREYTKTLPYQSVATSVLRARIEQDVKAGRFATRA